MSTGQAYVTAQRYLSESEKHTSSLTKVAASQIRLYYKRHEEALTEAARAIALDTNDPEAYVAMALAMITTGRPEAGLEFVETALRLNPRHPSHYVLAHSMVYFSMDNLEQAAAVLEDGLERDRGAVELAPLLAATYAHLGRREDARTALLLWQPEASQFELQNLASVYHFPYDWTADQRAIKNRLVDGLNIAGLPLAVTVANLIETLKHEGLMEPRRTAQALGWFGPRAAEAVPALVEVLADEDDWVRSAAVEALGKIGPPADAAIPALEAMQDEDFFEFYVKQALKDIRGY